MRTKQGKEVEILVPKDAPHGDVIVRALLWMVENSEEVKLPAIRGSAPGPCHEPILPDGMLTTRAEIDPKHIVWITGRTQSRIGVICAYGQAFVPEYGVLPLKNFRWANRKLARSPGMQQLLNDALDEAFEARLMQRRWSTKPNRAGHPKSTMTAGAIGFGNRPRKNKWRAMPPWPRPTAIRSRWPSSCPKR